MSDMQNINLSMPDRMVVKDSFMHDNTNAAGSTPSLPPTKRPRLIGPEINPVNLIIPESTTLEIVEGRTVGTQTFLPGRVVMCVVCGEVEARVVLVPCGHRCGHRCVCEMCLCRIGRHACTNATYMEVGFRSPFNKDCKCPLCRTVVREVVTLYE